MRKAERESADKKVQEPCEGRRWTLVESLRWLRQMRWPTRMQTARWTRVETVHSGQARLGKQKDLHMKLSQSYYF
jgi:hypothetical protein